MNAYLRALFVGVTLSLSVSGAFALDDGINNPYADCMNGCWRSHDYCKVHQSKEIDCDHQLGQCIEYCESTYDEQVTRPIIRILPPPTTVYSR